MSRGACLNLLPPETKAARARRRARRRAAAVGAVAVALLAAGTGWLAVQVREMEEQLLAAGGPPVGEHRGLAGDVRSLAALRRRVEEAEALLAVQRRRGPVPGMLAGTDAAARAAGVRLLRVEASAEGRLVVNGEASSLQGVASFVRRLRERGFRDVEITFPAEFAATVGFQVVLQGGRSVGDSG